jgi:hypothetical protein
MPFCRASVGGDERKKRRQGEARMVLYHARSVTNAIADPIAYDLGRRGVKVSTPMLLQRLKEHNAIAYEAEEKNLHRRVRGVGAVSSNMLWIVSGLGVFLMALFVDYHIVREFWTWALSNENGELQQALRESVVFKSLQVVFATLAIHFVLTQIGTGGRAAYGVFIFLLTIGMITGVGLLWATNSLPPGAKIFGVDIHGSADSVQKTLDALGLKPVGPAPAQVTPDPNAIVSGESIKTYQSVIWLSALSVLFLIVASVGAMALDWAVQSFSSLMGGAIHESHIGAAGRSNTMRDRLARVRVERGWIGAPEFWRHKIADFVTSYTSGVLSQRFTTARTQELLDAVTDAAQEAESRIAGEAQA